MPAISLHILRVGLGVTFLWIGILIWRDPELWGSFMQPWAADLLVSSVENTMKTTAVLDMLIGLALLLGFWTWIAAGLAALHLVVVIVTVGLNDITVRDFGLLTASLALSVASMPQRLRARFSADTLR